MGKQIETHLATECAKYHQHEMATESPPVKVCLTAVTMSSSSTGTKIERDSHSTDEKAVMRKSQKKQHANSCCAREY